MSLPSRTKTIDRVFQKDPNLKRRILDAVAEAPHSAALFEDIASYCESYQTSSHPRVTSDLRDEPAAKKRKLENGVTNGDTLSEQKRLLRVNDVSFSMPQRKKLHLELIQQGGHSWIRGRDTKTDQVEFSSNLSSYRYAFRLPVPEKAQKQYNFCLLPTAESLLASPPSEFIEPVVCSVNAGPLKSYDVDETMQEHLQDREDVLETSLDFAMQASQVHIAYPHEAEFSSATPESHRKGEKAYHVKAFKGSKEGFLFFLDSGIFFGFKKPLQFFPFDIIESTSYTSVLQRTFNLSITYQLTPDEEVQEVEFAMIDQSDFPGIDTYIRKHELQDASMAEARRAKKTNAHGIKKEFETGDTDVEDDRTELEKAQQEMEDKEDELEEDFEPSDADSDGSGSSSDEEEEEDTDGAGEDRDLVAHELGSEAEDVEPGSDDDDQL